MLDCSNNTIVALPKGPEVLIKYAESSAGLNATSVAGALTNYISFSTNGGLTWSPWKLFANTTGGTTGDSGLLFSRYAQYDLGTTFGSYDTFTSGATTMEYAAPADTLDIAGQSFEIEALFTFKNTISSVIRKVGIRISDSVGNIVIPFETLDNGSGVEYNIVVKGTYTFTTLTSASYLFNAIKIGTPSIVYSVLPSTYSSVSATNIITIAPVGDNVTAPGVADMVTCKYLNIHKN